MRSKAELYKYIKMGGLISFIPLILVSGPLIGFTAGNYINDKFKSGNNIVIICTVAGLVFSLAETVRIIKMLIGLSK